MSPSLADADRLHPPPVDSTTTHPKSQLSARSTNDPKHPEDLPSSPPRRMPDPPSPSSDAAADDDKDDEPEPEHKLVNDLGVPEDIIDLEIFRQILDLDDEEMEFSREMTTAYLSQAADTFKKMDKAVAAKDLPSLHHLGHYLKGSSAAIGIWRVQAACEKIQHFGQLRDEKKGIEVSTETALREIIELLEIAKTQNTVAEAWLRTYYNITEDEAP